LRGAFGVDTQLIDDGSCFLTDVDAAVDAAKIGAFIVAPEYVRQGIGRAPFMRCEAEACARDLTNFELMSTLTADVMIEFVPMRKEFAI
jgi:hypothetical protein